MAANSKREQIIANIVTALEAVSSINAVERKQLSESDLGRISSQQMPFVGVVGKLPKILSTTKGGQQYRSALDVVLFCYARDNETPDSTISNLADDIWAAIMADQQRGTLAIATKILPDMPSGIFSPYCAFSMTVQVEYSHSNAQI